MKLGPARSRSGWRAGPLMLDALPRLQTSNTPGSPEVDPSVSWEIGYDRQRARCKALRPQLRVNPRKGEVDALGVILISRGFERCCSNKKTPPYHSNLSFVTLRIRRPTLLRAPAYRTPSEANPRRRCGHASRFLWGNVCPYLHREVNPIDGPSLPACKPPSTPPQTECWPLQDIRLQQSVCARANHPFLAPPHLHCPHDCYTIARLLRNIRSPPNHPFVCHTLYKNGIGNIL